MTAMAASSVPAVSLEAEEERGDWLPACRAPARICSDKLRTSLVSGGGRWQREVVEPLVLRSDHHHQCPVSADQDPPRLVPAAGQPPPVLLHLQQRLVQQRLVIWTRASHVTRYEETRDVTWLGPRVLLGTGGLVRGAVTLVSDPPADHHEVWRIVSSISLVADSISLVVSW